MSVVMNTHLNARKARCTYAGEPLNETGLDGLGLVVRSIHRVSLEPASSAGVTRRTALADLMWRPVIRFAPLVGSTPAQWVSKFQAQTTGLATALPPNLHILTTHSYGPKQLLLRVSHSYEVGEDTTWSQNASVGLASLLKGVNIASITEMTLTANQPLSAVEPVTYQLVNGTQFTLPVVPDAPNGGDLTITLSPMQIRTFMVTLA
jgi:lysosomal alpha-mannosidase